MAGTSPVHLHDIKKEDAVVHRSAQIDGPVVFGGGCVVGPDVRIVGPAVVGPGCQLLDGALVNRAILWQNVKLGQGAKVLSSIVGNNCSIGDNSSIASDSVLADDVVVTDGSEVESNARIWPGVKV